MQFKATFCDPFKPDIIELGEIRKEDIIDKFKSINFREYLDLMKQAREDEIHFSPSLEIENTANKNGLAISAVEGRHGDMEYYLFYQRPKTVKKFFGLVSRFDENYLSDFTLYDKDAVIECLTALIKDDSDFLENKSKR